MAVVPGNGLQHEGGHGFRALVFDHPLQLLGAGQAAALKLEPIGAAVAVALGNMGHVEHQILIGASPGRAAAQRERAKVLPW